MTRIITYPNANINPMDMAYLRTRITSRALDRDEPQNKDICGDEPSECCDQDKVFKLLALADPLFTDPVRNDFASFLYELPIAGGTINFALQKWTGATWQTVVADLSAGGYGTYYAPGIFTTRPLFTGFRLEWRAVLIAHGVGIYRVQATGTFFGDSWTDCSRMYCLQEYSDAAADMTVRFEWNNNGIITTVTDGFIRTDYGNINWQDMVRLKGSFGYMVDEQEVQDVSFYDGYELKVERIRDRTNYTYKFKSGYYPSWVHSILKDYAFKSNSLLVTDYGRLSKFDITRKPIIKQPDGYSPVYDNVYQKWYKVEANFRDKYDDLGYRANCSDDGNNCTPVTIKDENGNIITTVPSGGEYVQPEGGPCDDATVNVNGNLFSTVASGATLNVPVVNSASTPVGTIGGGQVTIGDSTVTVRNTALTTITTLNPVAESSSTYTIPDDSVRNSDSTYVANDIVQGVQKVLPDITFTDTDGTVTNVPSVKNISATQISALTCAQLNNTNTGLTFSQRQVIQAVRGLRTGQTTSYRTGDDGDYEFGRGASFTTLTCNNPFGNTNRFTDRNGEQTYSNNIVVDWLTGLMWYRIPTTGADWNAAVDGSEAATTGGYTDWFLPNFMQLFSIASFGNTQLLNYAPFSLTITTTGSTLWTSTTRAASTTEAYILSVNGSTSNVAKTGTNRSYIYCRQFTYSNGVFS